MGQFNANPVTEINPEVKQNTMISRLINSAYYFIDYVYILQSKNKCRLVVLHRCKVLCDNYYNTVRGCRIAFEKIFKNKAWDETIKPQWSHFYDPDKDWLEEKQRRLEKR